MEWLFTSGALQGRAWSFAVLLSLYHLNTGCWVSEISTLLNYCSRPSHLPSVSTSHSSTSLHLPNTRRVLLNLEPLNVQLPPTLSGFVFSFGQSTEMEKYGGYGSCSWILWTSTGVVQIDRQNRKIETATRRNEARWVRMNPKIRLNVRAAEPNRDRSVGRASQAKG